MNTQYQQQIEDAADLVNARRALVEEKTQALADASRQYDEAVKGFQTLAVDGASMGVRSASTIALDLDDADSIKTAARVVFDKVLSSGGFARIFS